MKSSAAAAAASEKPLLSEVAEDANTSQMQHSQDHTPKRSKRSRRRPSNGVIFSNDNQEVLAILMDGFDDD